MTRTKKLVDDTFKDCPRDDLLQYIEWLRSAMQDLCQSLRRTIGLALLLIAIFELVVQSPNVALTIGSFVISNRSPVLVFIPAFVAYLFLQGAHDTNRLSFMQDTFSAVFARWSPVVERDGFDAVILPTQALYWNMATTMPYSSKLLKKLEYGTQLNVATIVTLGLIVFQVQAYYILFSHSHSSANLAIVFIGAIIASCCLMLGGVLFIMDPE